MEAIRGWLSASDEQRCEIVATYFRLADGWDEPVISRRTDPARRGDPLFAVWAHRTRRAGDE